MSETTVIDATGRFPGDPGYMKRRLGSFRIKPCPENVIDCISKFHRELTEEEVRALFCPEIKLLPFIVMKEGENPCNNSECYWHDEPSKHRHVDYKRGRTYAQLTIKAIQRDYPRYRSAYAARGYLVHIFEAMINDAVERRRKGGKGSRAITTATMDGFLDDLADYICKAAKPSDPIAS